MSHETCEHIYGFDAEYPEYENEAAKLEIVKVFGAAYDYWCKFCPECGEGLRKEEP